jgi:hypothetical protein
VSDEANRLSQPSQSQTLGVPFCFAGPPQANRSQPANLHHTPQIVTTSSIEAIGSAFRIVPSLDLANLLLPWTARKSQKAGVLAFQLEPKLLGFCVALRARMGEPVGWPAIPLNRVSSFITREQHHVSKEHAAPAVLAIVRWKSE